MSVSNNASHRLIRCMLRIWQKVTAAAYCRFNSCISHCLELSGVQPPAHGPHPAHDELLFSPRRPREKKHHKRDIRNYMPCKLFIYCLTNLLYVAHVFKFRQEHTIIINLFG